MSATRLLRFLTILAVLFAPISMMSGHAAMAMPAAAAHKMDQMAAMDAADHCAGMDKQPGDQPGSSIDCMIACSVLLAAGSEVAIHPMAPLLIQPIPLARGLQGLHPESDPPPPRFA